MNRVKDETKRRAFFWGVRISPSEKELSEALCQRHGMGHSAFLRYAIHAAAEKLERVEKSERTAT